MFTRNWDAAILAAIFQDKTPATFATDMTGAEQSITAGNGHWMIQIGYSSAASSYNFPQISVLEKSANGKGGAIIGTGNTPPTYEDYTLAGDVISTFNYTQVTKKETTDNGVKFTATYSITNTGTEAFTISEIGLQASSSSSSGASVKLLLERTVLDSPVTIEPGAVGQVTYTINVNMPLV